MAKMTFMDWLKEQFGDEADSVLQEMQAQKEFEGKDLTRAIVKQTAEDDWILYVPETPAPRAIKSKEQWEKELKAARKSRRNSGRRFSDIDARSNLQMIYFEEYVPPNGFLPPFIACHALWYYYLLALTTYQNHDVANNPEEVLVLEGAVDPVANYRQLIKSIAAMYNVAPEEMVKFWSAVDMQARALQMPLLPDLEKFRFNRPMELH